VCVRAHGGRGVGSAPHGGARWCGFRGTRARAVRHATRARGWPYPTLGPTSTTPLCRGSGGGGGGCLWPAPCPGSRPGTTSPRSSRDGRGRPCTGRGGCVTVGGSAAGRSMASRLWIAHPGATPAYPDPCQRKGDLSGSQGDQIWRGAGFFPSGFTNHPATSFEFFAFEGIICLVHLGWLIWPPALEMERVLLTAETAFPAGY